MCASVKSPGVGDDGPGLLRLAIDRRRLKGADRQRKTRRLVQPSKAGTFFNFCLHNLAIGCDQEAQDDRAFLFQPLRDGRIDRRRTSARPDAAGDARRRCGSCRCCARWRDGRAGYCFGRSTDGGRCRQGRRRGRADDRRRCKAGCRRRSGCRSGCRCRYRSGGRCSHRGRGLDGRRHPHHRLRPLGLYLRLGRLTNRRWWGCRWRRRIAQQQTHRHHDLPDPALSGPADQKPAQPCMDGQHPKQGPFPAARAIPDGGPGMRAHGGLVPAV